MNVAQCPRCGFRVEITSERMQGIFDEHMEDCPDRLSTLEIRRKEKEDKKLQFFEKKQQERADPNVVKWVSGRK